MILRRLSQNLKEQNWTAITIEFVLLVAGVFLGIQVANWNEARRESQSERAYLDRLSQEVASLLPRAQSSEASIAQNFGLIEELNDFLASGQAGDVLNERHCIAAGRSHIYAATIVYPPTIKELISTGRILLIRDDELRTAIMSFDQAYADMTQLRTDIQIDRRLLARHYPTLINSGLSTDWSGASCDFEGMRNDQAFLNDFTDNMRRYAAYAVQVGRRQREILASLAQVLAAGSTGRTQQAQSRGADATPTDEHGGGE